MPIAWPKTIAARLSKMTTRPIHVRPHPGDKNAGRPLQADLETAFAVVTWGSGAALKAMAAGVPCFHDLQGWIGEGASKALASVSDLESVRCDDRARVTMFERLAWCQWRVEEIASGYALDWLLTPRGRPS